MLAFIVPVSILAHAAKQLKNSKNHTVTLTFLDPAPILFCFFLISAFKKCERSTENNEAHELLSSLLYPAVSHMVCLSAFTELCIFTETRVSNNWRWWWNTYLVKAFNQVKPTNFKIRLHCYPWGNWIGAANIKGSTGGKVNHFYRITHATWIKWMSTNFHKKICLCDLVNACLFKIKINFLNRQNKENLTTSQTSHIYCTFYWSVKIYFR